MKKSVIIPIVILTITLLIFSCKEKATQSEKIEDTVSGLEQDDTEIFENNKDLTNTVPSFENSAVQDYVNTYEVYLEEYAKAVDNQDIEALSNLGPKGQELSIKAKEISGNMSVEDAQKFTHYMTEKAKSIRALTLKMSK